MKPLRQKSASRPEDKIVEELTAFLKARDWLVKKTHGNIFQFGFPDLYCAHFKYGQRWIEVKVPERIKFTGAQLEFFPQLIAHGVGVWVLVAATENEYLKLFRPSNYYQITLERL